MYWYKTFCNIYNSLYDCVSVLDGIASIPEPSLFTQIVDREGSLHAEVIGNEPLPPQPQPHLEPNTRNHRSGSVDTVDVSNSSVASSARKNKDHIRFPKTIRKAAGKAVAFFSSAKGGGVPPRPEKPMVVYPITSSPEKTSNMSHTLMDSDSSCTQHNHSQEMINGEEEKHSV